MSKSFVLSQYVMNRNKLTTFSKWLNATELFARPGKQLPGKWQLYEYYIDRPGDLEHITTDLLNAKNQFWNIDFTDGGFFVNNSNVPVPITETIKNGSWNISKNYITLVHSEDYSKNVEFQFAINKAILKLLKKDGVGKIEFFGFFRKLDEPADSLD